MPSASPTIQGQALRKQRAPAALPRSPLLLLVPAILFLIICFLVPLFLLGLESIRSPEQGVLSLEAYRSFFSDSFQRSLLWNSVGYAAIVTGICLMLGYPFAYAIVHARPALQGVFLLAVFLPLTASIIVRAFGWTILLRSNGILNSTLLALGIIDEPLQLLFTFPGLIIGTVNILLPFMVLPIYAVMRSIDPRLSGAAAVLGASPVYAFLHVTLPLSVPGIIAGVTLVFTQAVAAYAIPTLLAGQRIRLMSRQAANYFLVLRDDSMGATTSMILLGTAVAAVALASILLSTRNGSRAAT